MFRTLLLLLLAASVAGARPPYRRALTDLLDLPPASPLNDCATCHLAGTDEERPHNAFGARLKAVRRDLRKAAKPDDITSRLLAVADEDADRDGAGNLLELLAGTSPSDATQKPDARALAGAQDRRGKLLAALAGYRWRPFERVQRPPVPAYPGLGPVDAFLEEKRRERGLTAGPEAPRAVLLRRVTLDLTGLPPTADEVRAFLNDGRPDAYERVVDRLLASPAFAERWGRHWMDVWRYSDWAGFGAQIRDSQPHVWRWRDWILDALDADKPYSRMVVEMLAADEAAPDDADALRATGFLVRNYKLLSREKWLQDAVDHSAMAFLGLTLGCARCHDHMYDAVTQVEYFQVRAIFTPHKVRTDRVPGEPLITKDGLTRVYDADPGAKTFLLVRGDDRTPAKEELSPGVPELLGGRFEVKPVPLPRHAFQPDRRPFVMAQEVASLGRKVANQDREVIAARAREATAGLMGPPLATPAALAYRGALREGEVLTRAAAAEEVVKTRLLAEVERLEDAGQGSSPGWKAAAERVVASERRLNHLEARRRAWRVQHRVGLDPKSKVPPAKQLADARKAVADAEAALRQPPSTAYRPRAVSAYPATSTGRRLAYANWIASRDNPLAARVAVNHVWARHFGTGLAPGMFDLGRNAPPATHPALLDWLAAEFMDSGWSLKALHRRIVTSAAYRADSRPAAGNVRRDPDNVYLWRFAPRRVEAEVVRDALLAAGGTLDRRRGGPEVSYRDAMSSPRRSVYLQSAQEKQAEFLLLFDCASVTEAYQRKQAVMPSQALALLNSEAAVAAARAAAGRIAETEDAAFVRAAFVRMLGRDPTAEEMAECAAFLRAGRDPRRARENLMMVLINHHEFVTIR